jgi:hypothetical protein
LPPRVAPRRVLRRGHRQGRSTKNNTLECIETCTPSVRGIHVLAP